VRWIFRRSTEAETIRDAFAEQYDRANILARARFGYDADSVHETFRFRDVFVLRRNTAHLKQALKAIFSALFKPRQPRQALSPTETAYSQRGIVCVGRSSPWHSLNNRTMITPDTGLTTSTKWPNRLKRGRWKLMPQKCAFIEKVIFLPSVFPQMPSSHPPPRYLAAYLHRPTRLQFATRQHHSGTPDRTSSSRQNGGASSNLVP
jgi:hypothetical protein